MGRVSRELRDPAEEMGAYLVSGAKEPLLICGDAATLLAGLPQASVDCVVTSPPYWKHRRYASGGIGQERTVGGYVEAVLKVTAQLVRVLRPTGSLWLNLGDSYHKKGLVGVPWRVALALTDEQGWILRNEVIWHKVKGGPDNSADRLRNVHEQIFHLVRQPLGYVYDVDTIRSAPRRAKVVGGAVVSATGVTGVRYRRQIELSTSLGAAEKEAALAALEAELGRVAKGELDDFRMIIRGQQRTTHSDSEAVSGRAKEILERGFYFLRYHPKGSKPGDVWDVLPEDTQNRAAHFAPFPADLCRLPILATCPIDGVVLDPFCGTGTTNLVAWELGRKSVGIDLSAEYLELARVRWEATPSRDRSV